MAKYYGIQRSDEYLAHYGIKGMKWGVRKAIEKGDKKALFRQYTKASKKLNKLYKKADLLKNASNIQGNRQTIALGTGGTLFGGTMGAIGYKNGVKDPIAKIGLAGTAVWGIPTLAAGAIGMYKNKKRLTQKGHEKAVKDVQNWEKGMNEAFKNTEFKNTTPKYKDEYNTAILINPENQNKKSYVLTRKKPIKGSHLVKEYSGKDKENFLNMIDAHHTSISNKKGYSTNSYRFAVTSPTGTYYMHNPNHRIALYDFTKNVSNNKSNHRRKRK